MQQSKSVKSFLIISLAFLVLIFTFITIYVFYFVTSRIIEKQISQYAAGTIKKVIENVEYYLKDMDQISTGIMMDEYFI